MIYYLATQAHMYTIRGHLEGLGQGLADVVVPLPYEDVFDAVADEVWWQTMLSSEWPYPPKRVDALPSGTYIFADYDRLLPPDATRAAMVWQMLANRGSEVQLLNHPTRSMARYELLRTLFERGINAFNVYRPTEARWPERYPVILRGESDHREPKFPLLRSRAELEDALAVVGRRGQSRENLLVVEFCDTVDARGIYRKYPAIRVGSRVFTEAIQFSKQWLIKRNDIDRPEELLAEEREFIRTDPYHAQISEIFELAGIDYGRMDYGILDGKIQVWEINSNPNITISDPRLLVMPPSPARAWITEWVVREFEAALRTIEAARSKPEPTVVAVSGLQTPIVEQRSTDAQRDAGATEPDTQLERHRGRGLRQRSWPLRAARGAAVPALRKRRPLVEQTLSLWIVTKNSAGRIERLLQAARMLADELVVAVDRSSTDATEAVCAGYADKLFRIDPVGSAQWVMAWMNERCTGDWILRLDDDELPSAGLAAALPRLLRDRECTHYWLPRRWLIGADGARWIAQRPWWPDWQLRLFRNIPSLVYIPGSVHMGYVVQGAARFLDEGSLYHLDLVVHSEQQRREKVARYRRLAPDYDQAAFYLPLPEAALRTLPIPAGDPPWRPCAPPGLAGRLGWRARGPRHAFRARARPAVEVTFPEIRRSALQECQFGPSLFRARLEVRDRPASMTAGQLSWVVLALRNDSPVAWPFHSLGVSDEAFREQWQRTARQIYEFGGDGWPVPGLISPRVRVGYHWLREDGQIHEYEGHRTNLPHTLHPGEATQVVAQVLAPAGPGTYRLQWDLVIEHVAWFSSQGWQGPEVMVRVE